MTNIFFQIFSCFYYKILFFSNYAFVFSKVICILAASLVAYGALRAAGMRGVWFIVAKELTEICTLDNFS